MNPSDFAIPIFVLSLVELATVIGLGIWIVRSLYPGPRCKHPKRG